MRALVHTSPSMRNPRHEQHRTLWALSTTRTTSRLRRVQHSTVNAIPSCTRTSPCPPILLFHAGGMADDAFYCVIVFSWHVLHVKGRPPKGIYSVPHSVCCRPDRDLADPPSPLPPQVDFLEPVLPSCLCHSVRCLPRTTTTLFTIDADFHL